MQFFYGNPQREESKVYHRNFEINSILPGKCKRNFVSTRNSKINFVLTQKCGGKVNSAAGNHGEIQFYCGRLLGKNVFSQEFQKEIEFYYRNPEKSIKFCDRKAQRNSVLRQKVSSTIELHRESQFHERVRGKAKSATELCRKK